MTKAAAVITKLFTWSLAALGAGVLVALSLVGAAALPTWFWLALATALMAAAIALIHGPYTMAERVARLRRAVVRIAAPLLFLALYTAATHILVSSTGTPDYPKGSHFDALADLADVMKVWGLGIVLGGLIIALFAAISSQRDEKLPPQRRDKPPFRRGDSLPPSQREN